MYFLHVLLLGLVFVWQAAAYNTVTTTHEECAEESIDLAFVIDSSGSIGSSNFMLMRKFLAQFIDNEAVNSGIVRVALVSFSSFSNIEFYFDTFTKKKSIQSAINHMTYMSRATNITGALRLTRTEIFCETRGDRPEVSDLVILATDGESNLEGRLLDGELKFWKGPNTKQIKVFGIGIGPKLAKKENQKEIRKIVTKSAKGEDENVIFVDSYEDLMLLQPPIFEKICNVITKTSVVKDGEPCHQEGQEEKARCKHFVCQNGYWVRYYTGCLFDGCMQWGDEKMDGCNKYKCCQKGQCMNAGDTKACVDTDVKLTDVGCMVDGTCKDQDSTWMDDRKCEEYRCTRSSDKDGKPVGAVEVIDTGCVDPEGNCRDIGYKYSTHCVGFQCQKVVENYETVVKFVTYEAGCKENGKCIPLGETITEDCNVLVCAYDDSTKMYDFVMETRGCYYEGLCYSLDQQWEDTDTCTKYSCKFNDVTKKAVVRKRVAGCKNFYGCVPKGGVMGKSMCIDYRCGSKGEMELISAGCPVGDGCKPLDSTWREEGVCAQFYCYEGELEDGFVTTDIVTEVECHDFQGNCLKAGQTTDDNCMTYECTADGSLKRIGAACMYKGKCYPIGKNWFDRDTCKEVKCKADDVEGAVYFAMKYGCVDDNGVCYQPGDNRTFEYSCITETCGVDHVFRATLCEYKSQCFAVGAQWTDYEDCLTFYCVEDPISASAIMEEQPYGCLHDMKCYAPGESRLEGCETFQCFPDGKGFSLVEEACAVADECRKVGEKWFDKDMCVKYGCIEDDEGVSIQEMVMGCVDEYQDKCYKHGADIGDENECIKYKCVNGKIEATQIGCPHQGGCMNVTQVIKDEEGCMRYECILNEEPDGSMGTIKKERSGCVDHETCYWPGQTKTEACVTYKCKKKVFKIVDAQCEYKGECKVLNAKWQHEKKCLQFSCIRREGEELPTVVKYLWGCRDNNGKCRGFGYQTKINQCVIDECQWKQGLGANFYPVEFGCLYRGKCKAVDDGWLNKQKCVKQTCLYEEGAAVPEVMDSPYGCHTGGKCYPFGANMTDEANECIKYKCTKYEIFSPIETGCPYNGKCKKDRARWVDKTECIRYKCKSEMVTATEVIMHTIMESGCRDFEGSCMWAGDQIEKDCTVYQCDPTRDGLVIISEGCQDGDRCRSLNATWFDAETCTDYTCVYSPEINDIIIEAITKGCKDTDGKCFTKGEKKEESCTKFLCNKYSNFKPVSIGCEWKGKCYKVDESWEKNCVRYTCTLVSKGMNFVETHVNASHGCLDDNGQCYMPGEKRTDGCVQYVCHDGGEFAVSKFACDTEEGCLKPGDFYTKDCVEYTCNSESESLEPVYFSCMWKDGCKELDSKWFNKANCRGYRCAYSAEDNDVKVVERTAGCRDDEGQCVKSGGVMGQKDDCVKFKCKNGELYPIEVGCEWEDKCAPIGSTWIKDCVLYACQIEESGPTFIETKVVSHHGCTGCKGKCYMPGEKVTSGCSEKECMFGGFFQYTKTGCMTNEGHCVAVGEIVDYGTRKSVCGESGQMNPIPAPSGCYNGNFKFFKLGENMRQGCELYECQQRGYTAGFFLIEKGCLFQDKCHDVGDTWHDFANCVFYTCTSQQSSVGVQEMIVKQLDGCWDSPNEKCRQHEEKWFDGCFEKQCLVKKKKNNAILKKIVLVSGGCAQKVGDQKICHAPGEIWSEVRESMCVQLQCVVKKKVYTTKIYKPLCIDTSGRCREVGDAGFDTEVGGRVYYDCKCRLKEKKINYICKG